jgi:hypothetical protein
MSTTETNLTRTGDSTRILGRSNETLIERTFSCIYNFSFFSFSFFFFVLYFDLHPIPKAEVQNLPHAPSAEGGNRLKNFITQVNF